MVQSANLSDCHYASQFPPLYRPRLRRVLPQRKMRPGLVIVRKIRSQDSAQRTFVEHDHMIQALPAYGTNHALDVGSLPRRPRSRKHFPDLHASDLLSEVGTEDLVVVTQQIPRDTI